jgi:phosphotransferase system enzyme I (PtsI)
MSEQIIQGITASEGIQIGLAYHYDQKHLESAVVIETISEAQVDLELERLQRSKDSVARSLDEILERHQHRFVEKQMAIIKGHKGLLDDPSFMGEMVKLIRKQLITSEKAVQTVVEKYVRLFQGMEKEYLRERAQDIQDVGNRLLEDLLGKVRRGLEEIEAGTILIAHDLTPSDTIQIDPDRVLAFITKIGGKTSHTAILARSMGMPALVGIGKALDQVYNGDVLIVDGKAGICIIHPEAATIMEYEEKRRLALEHNKQLKTFQHVKAETSDGVQFEISTNIGSVEESMASLKSGAEGVGLFRTEFML